MEPVKILFIATSHDSMGETGKKTGLWLEELATPYYVFKDAGAVVTLASPRGGRVPLDPKSQSIMVATSSTKRFLQDEEAMNFLSHSIALEEIKAEDFDVAFIPGGHGPVWDIAGNNLVKQLLEAFNNDGKAIAAVCHGVAALLALQNEKGALLIKDRHLTGFSNSEEQSAGLTAVIPILLETELFLAGALYSKAANYTSYVVTDGNIITGQNAASSVELAKKLTAYLQNNRPIQKPILVINDTV